MELGLILKYSPFNTERDLQKQFDRIKDRTGEMLWLFKRSLEFWLQYWFLCLSSSAREKHEKLELRIKPFVELNLIALKFKFKRFRLLVTFGKSASEF